MIRLAWTLLKTTPQINNTKFLMYKFNENIQRGILYFSKNDLDFFLQTLNLVKPEFFEYPAHGKIFNIVKEYYERYHLLPTDDFILENARATLSGRENLSDYEDELQYINKLDTSSVSNSEYFLDIVENFARTEAMKQAIAESVSLIRAGKVDEVEGLVKKALLVSRTVDTGQDYFESYLNRWDRATDEEKRDKFNTFLPAIDKSLEGGLSKKELAMVVAPPGVGKSLFLVNQGVKSLVEGRKVLYVSLEMSEDKIAQRFDSVTTLIPQHKLKEESAKLTVKERLDLFQESFPGSRLMIKEFPTGTASVNTLKSLLVQLKNYDDFDPDLLIIDYLELLRPLRENQHEYIAQQKVAEELRGLAMEKSILVWTATQTNRQGRSVKIITDAELGDSYGKMRTCDFALSLNQTEEEFDNGKMRAYVIKSRNGRPRFLTPMHVDYGTLRMSQGEELDADE
jgi:replicative DNA helicase